MVEQVGTIESANKWIHVRVDSQCLIWTLVCLPARATLAAFLDRLTAEFFVVLGNGGAASRIARLDARNTNGQDQQANIVQHLDWRLVATTRSDEVKRRSRFRRKARKVKFQNSE